ncbi:MAG: MFS transporter [Lachnospiraceae bacterium]|jgi:PPP family 3-phenylpropionic acid transporter
MGIALFFQSLLELPAMLLYQKFRDRVKTGSVLIFSGVMFSVRHICTAAASSLIPFFFIQLLQAGAFALFIPASVYFADEFFDSADAAKGQSLVTMCITIAGIIATFFGGFLLDGFGVHRTLVFFSAISVLGSLILVFAVRKMEKMVAGRQRAVS